MEPISLFTHITDATATSSRTMASNDARSTTPSEVMASRRSSAPSWAAVCTASSTALCSMGVVTTAVLPRSRAHRQAPSTARLSDSVPPDVKQISSAWAPRQRATRSRASSRAARASRPQRCMLEGFPNRAP